MTSKQFRTLLRQRLESISDRILLTVLPSGKEVKPTELTGGDLVAKSVEVAEKYSQASAGSVVLLLLPHCTELFLLHLGLCLTDRLPAVLAWPTNRVDPEKYQRNILHQLRTLPATQVVTLPRLARNLDPGMQCIVTACPVDGYESFESLFSIDLKIEPVDKRPPNCTSVDATEALFLQFSGGTTGDQKCVVVTAPMLVNQLERLSQFLDFRQEDGVVSWLPLYHDMGLIACFWLPLWNMAHSTQFAASDWLMNPGLLFHLMSKQLATFCWLPNFAFSYLAAQKNRIKYAVDLSHVRAWINCSEPVRRRSFEDFAEAFSDLGICRKQCQASYAMAENVFAVTQTPLRQIPATFNRNKVRGAAFDSPEISYNLIDDYYVSSGQLLADTSVRIRSSRGELCADGAAGAIEINGTSVFSGYWGNSGFQSQALTVDSWYATGDYGFMNDKDLYVIGRTKDIIIAGGVNIIPEDIEALVNTVEGVYPGRVAAFGIDDEAQGTESLAVVAEMRGAFAELPAAALEKTIRQLISSALGIVPRYARVMPERWIVKSTAGKISRRETHLRFLQELQNPLVTSPGR